MSQTFASQQPAGFQNHVQKIAIIGAGGQVGSHITKALIAQGQHQVTAISRTGSTSVMPEGLDAVKHVNYADKDSIVAALKGQDALIVTLSTTFDRQHVFNVLDAAIEAGVQWIVPNEWGADLEQEELSRDILLGIRAKEVREYIGEHGGSKTHWVSFSCSFWYEYSLAGTEIRYGFNFKDKKLTLYGDGNIKIPTSTWPQVGRAVARVFALPILPDKEGDTGPFLSDYADKAVYVSSFFVSQRDMLDSVLRVTGGQASEWTISHEDAKARFHRGKQLFAQGNPQGFGLLLYARVFYPEGESDFTHKLDNAKLGLPTEDLDTYTKIAIEMAEASGA